MKKKRVVLWVLTILTLIFIFGQSFLNQTLSRRESTAVKHHVVQPVHQAVTGSKKLPFDVRDAAHAVEFLVLGFELTLLFKEKNRLKRPFRSISFCGPVALLDESIQFLSDRAPQVIDLWHDLLGAALGSLAAALLLALLALRPTGPTPS